MKTKTLNHVLAISTLSILGISATTALANEVQQATDKLKACVESHMPAERKRVDPNVEKLLGACDVELKAVLALVPNPVRDKIKYQIKHESDRRLKNNGV